MISRIPLERVISMPRRKTMGEYLREARLAQGLSLDRLKKRIEQQYGVVIGESTIRELERDTFANPGFKTIEQVCRGLGLEPLDVMAMGLENPPAEAIKPLSASRFRMMEQIYNGLEPNRRVWFDEFLDMLIEKMRNG